MDKERICNQVELMLQDLIPRLTGKNYSYKLKGKERRRLLDLLALQEQHYNLDYKNMSIDEQRKNLTQLSNAFSEKVFGTKRNMFDILDEQLTKYFDNPGDNDFKCNTNFITYRDTVFIIVDKIYSDKHLQNVGEYAKKQSTDEAIGVLQHTREINTEDRDYLNKIHNKITIRVVKRYKRIYSNLSGIFEKYVRLLVWIKMLFNGKKPEYDTIKNKSLSSHVNFLNDDPMFSNLVAPFSTTIRNAISHTPQTVIDPLRQKIIFLDSRDSSKNVILGFSEFITKTKELGADVYILSMIGLAMNIRYVRQMKEYFKGLIVSETHAKPLET